MSAHAARERDLQYVMRLRKYAMLKFGVVQVAILPPYPPDLIALHRSPAMDTVTDFDMDSVSESIQTESDSKDIEIRTETRQPFTRERMAEANELYAQCLLMAGPQQSLRIFQVHRVYVRRASISHVYTEVDTEAYALS